MLLPSEILQNIFSFLPYTETYRLRSVCTSWKDQCEYHIYLQLKSCRQKLSVKIGEKGNTTTIDMAPVNYNFENQAIEFKPCNDDTEENNNGQQLSVGPAQWGRGRLQIVYSEWKEKYLDDLNAVRDLDLADRALALFHLKYNPSLEQIYRIPPPSFKKANNNRLRYVGDQGMVMCFSYIDPRSTDSAVDDTFDTTSISLRINYIHVTFSWILAGMNLGVTPQPLYANRYEELEDALEEHGVKEYCPYSEPVLEYVMRREFEDRAEIANENKGKSIVVLPIVNEKTNLELLQNKLRSYGLEPRILWKYTLAKNFILSGQSDKVEDVAKVIKKSEQEWELKRSAILNELKSK